MLVYSYTDETLIEYQQSVLNIFLYYSKSCARYRDQFVVENMCQYIMLNFGSKQINMFMNGDEIQKNIKLHSKLRAHQ